MRELLTWWRNAYPIQCLIGMVAILYGMPIVPVIFVLIWILNPWKFDGRDEDEVVGGFAVTTWSTYSDDAGDWADEE